MGNFFLFSSMWMLSLIFNYSVRCDVQKPDNNINQRLKKMEELVTEMQTHCKAQEQKNTAVLSSLLSQLTLTTEKLEKLETSHNKTLLELEGRDLELSELWANHSLTVAEVSELKASHNGTLVELQEISAKHNNIVMELEHTRSKLDDLGKRPIPVGNEGFFGRLLGNDIAVINKPINFGNILYDSETSYNNITGKYCVPRNGTYQIWFDLSYRHRETNIAFSIQTDNYIIDQAYGRVSDDPETASTTTMRYLQKGDYIWISSSVNLKLFNSYCHFGIVLLNAH